MRPLIASASAPLCLAVGSLLPAVHAQSYQDELHGNWIGPFDLEDYICPVEGVCGALREFAHAVLIPALLHV